MSAALARRIAGAAAVLACTFGLGAVGSAPGDGERESSRGRPHPFVLWMIG